MQIRLAINTISHRLWLGLVVFFCVAIVSSITHAAKQSESGSISVDFQQMLVSDVLHSLAKEMHQLIVVSPDVKGKISFHLHHVSAKQAFELLLKVRHLACVKQQAMWFILPNAALLQQEEEQMKLAEKQQENAPLLTGIWQIQYAKAEEIATTIDNQHSTWLSKRGIIHVDVRTNSICVQDIPDHLSKVTKLIKKLDIPIRQVQIEVRLFSIDSDYERELGIMFSQKPQKQPDSLDQTSLGNLPIPIARLSIGSVLDMKLAALESAGRGELLSSPSLFTANQQTASIESGEEIPYQEISKSGATGVTFKKAVLRLKVTPQILPGQRILLQLQVNQDKPSSRVILGVPTIMTRQVNTNVRVSDGQTIVLGGIFEASEDHIRQTIPFLSKIPLVGFLFQQQNVARSKRELLIFVTPNIVD